MRMFDNFFTGINYWDSKNAIYMWRNFDEKVIEEDLSKLEKCSITLLRVFPLWSDFQPLTAMYSRDGIYEFGMNGEHLPDTEAGKLGISEEMCKRFEIFCEIALKHNMKLIVAPLTGFMSFGMFVPPALEGKNPITDEIMVKWEIRYLKYFVNRFKDNPAIIAWNPGNEINCMPPIGSVNADQFYNWCSLLCNVIRVCDPNHPVISGIPSSRVATDVGNYKDVGEIFDIHAAHNYNIFSTPYDKVNSMRPVLDSLIRCRLGEDISGVPTFLEEFGATGYQNCSSKEECDYYRAIFHSIFAHGFHGIMWWCAFDQGKFDIAPYDWNNIGSDYGFFDKDGNEKPIAKEQKRLMETRKSLPDKLPKCKTDSLIIIPRDDTNGILQNAQTTFVLCKQAGLNPKFAYSIDKIPNAPIYILPSLNSHKPIPKRRLDEILKNVKDGSVLYLSLDRALFRNLPEIAGVRFFSREEKNVTRKIVIDNEKFEITHSIYHNIAPIDAEVLACDQNNEPVYFRKSYGKGYIYFSIIPIEGYLVKQSGIFDSSEATDYSIWYKKFAKLFDDNKVAVSSSPYICLTEHQKDDGDVYIYAINYSTKEETAIIDIKDSFVLNCIYGNNVENGKLTLSPSDASLFLLKKL